VTLPSAGTYLITMEAYVSAQARVTTRLFNVTAGAPVANSERIGMSSQDSSTQVGPSCGSYLVTVPGPTVIRLEAARDDALTCSILSGVLVLLRDKIIEKSEFEYHNFLRRQSEANKE
jgi:hypothetical protein